MGQSKRLKAGDLIHQVTLQSPVYTTAQSGERTVTSYTAAVTRWASIQALTGRELYLAEQTQSDQTLLFRFRPYSGLNEKWSILWLGRTYLLDEPPRDPVGDGEQVEVRCVLRTS